LSTTPSAPLASSQSLPNPDNRTPLRAKTLGTRLTPDELAEVEAAAKQSGKNVAEWLREVALRAARPSPDVNELLLSEIAATRYLLLNLFDASAKAAQKNESLPPRTCSASAMRPTVGSERRRKCSRNSWRRRPRPEAHGEETLCPCPGRDGPPQRRL
jgi:uncharacterized protein (DUF1778 family)